MLSGRSRTAAAFALAALVVASTTGCMTSFKEWIHQGFKVGPDYHQPGVEVGEAWIDSEQPGVNPGEMDYSEWWTVFNDPQLNELVLSAYEENIPLKIACLRILEARYQLGVARGYLLPQEQQVVGAYQRQQLSHNAYPFGDFSNIPGFRLSADDFSLGATAAWELDFWGRFRRMIESAEANVQIQQEDYHAALVLLQAEVAQNYIQMRTAEERLALARKNVELQERTLELVQARFDQGLVSELDVNQAKAILETTRSIIPMLELQRRLAQNRLCTLMGQPPQSLDDILQGPAKLPDVPPEVVVGIPADLLRRRPDVRKAERMAAAQCARIGVAEAEFYPHIAITGQIAFQADDFAHLINTDSIAGMVGPGFRWNVLNYGRIKNQVLAEDARFRQAVLGYQETVLRASEEVEGMITAFLKEQDRVRKLEKATEAIAKSVELATLQYQQGLIDFQRVLDSQRALVQQQDALAEARGNVAQHLIGVYKALGGGWQMCFRMQPGAVHVVSETIVSPADEGGEIIVGDAVENDQAPTPAFVPEQPAPAPSATEEAAPPAAPMPDESSAAPLPEVPLILTGSHGV